MTRRAVILVAAIALAAPAVTLAQQARPSVLAVDTAVSFDESVDTEGDGYAGVIFDSVISVNFGRGFQGLTRPFVQRLANSGEWNRQIWMATLRYERPGPVAVRVDGGYIAPPVGLANLSLRPQLNPTIAQPSSLFQGLPPLQPGSPRATLLGGIYPLGIVGTVSTVRWDARAGVIDTSPLRARRVFARVNPPQFANVVVGGGISPVLGLRLGASVTRGGWLRAGESPRIQTSRDATVFTVESEFSFRYTRLSAEWVRDAIGTDLGDRVASGWFAQGQQTLAPRWFVAGRFERMSSPHVALAGGVAGDTPDTTAVPQSLTGFEETVGFRLTPDVTLRAGHRGRRSFGLPDFEHQAAVSLVWARRWM